ncbi:MAG: phage portal protein [Kiritimatiellae bacterium]|nr:phage portal protein [Kiritimatiellia bacterium]
MAPFENLRSLFSPAVQHVYGGDMGVRVADMDAAQLYRTQPNLRAAVTFLADNAAQVPLKVYARRSDDDRPRVTDSPAAKLLKYPNPDMTPFEFRRWVYSDLLLYERFMMLVLPNKDTASEWEMRPVPNSWILQYKGASPFAPESVVISTGKSAAVEVPADKFVLWHGYDPNDPARQCSRIGALKDTLHEQVESNRFRRQMWHRGGRFNAYLTRPATVEMWSNEAFARFRETWKASWAGSEAGEGGGMPILEDGMEIKTVQFNSRDAQWYESVKLSREDVASVYHFNPALLWPGSGQTYASAKDNARALYSDCLAPTLMFATDRINHALLPMVGEPPEDYVAYDITIKTEGSFEEQVKALQTAVGAPFLTRDEARARLNLPAIGASELIVPLNVMEGGLASNHDTDPTVERYNAAPVAHVDEHGDVYAAKSAAPPRKARGEPTKDEADAITDVYRRFFRRQAESVLPKIGNAKAGSPSWWDAERWDAELADDLYGVVKRISDERGREVAAQLWGSDAEYDPARTEAYIRRMCERRAEMVNAATFAELEAVDDFDDDSDALMATPVGVFENAEDNRSDSAGAAFAAAAIGWTVLEAGRQNRRRGENVFKTWVVTSSNPRASHARMDGETVQYDRPFSNGATWPGDIDNLDVEEVANCRCQLEIEVRDR